MTEPFEPPRFLAPDEINHRIGDALRRPDGDVPSYVCVYEDTDGEGTVKTYGVCPHEAILVLENAAAGIRRMVALDDAVDASEAAN